jgi:hypothetical protein
MQPGAERVRALITSYKLMVNRISRRQSASPRAGAAYNMVNPCVFSQGRSLCSLKREIQTVAHRASGGDEG